MLNPAPPVDQNGYGQGKDENRPVYGGNQKTALGVRNSPLSFEKWKKRDYDQSVEVVEHV